MGALVRGASCSVDMLRMERMLDAKRRLKALHGMHELC